MRNAERGVVMALFLTAALACDGEGSVENKVDAGTVDAGTVDAGSGDAGPSLPTVTFRISNRGACTAKLLKTLKDYPGAGAIQVEQNGFSATAIPSCGCGHECVGNNGRDAFPINPGTTSEFQWSGHGYLSSGTCQQRPFAPGPVRLTVTYHPHADPALNFQGPEVQVSTTFDYPVDGGVVDLELRPPEDPLVDGGVANCTCSRSDAGIPECQ